MNKRESTVPNKNVKMVAVLMHDAGANKTATLRMVIYLMKL